jgi:hypothetical protein
MEIVIPSEVFGPGRFLLKEMPTFDEEEFLHPFPSSLLILRVADFTFMKD